MGIDELRKLLKETEDKLSIFIDADKLNEYDINSMELQSLLQEFLSDDEKIELLDYPIYLGMEDIVIASVSDENRKIQLLEKCECGYWEVLNVLLSLSDETKKKILYDEEFIAKYSLDTYCLSEIAHTLSKKSKEELLEDSDYIKNKLQFVSSDIVRLIEALSGEETRIKMIQRYSLNPDCKIELIETLSEKNKVRVIIEDNDLTASNKIALFSLLELDALNELFTTYIKDLESQGIRPYQVVMRIEPEKQLEFIDMIEDMGFTDTDKLEIFATLKPETKEKVNTSNLKEEYKRAISIETKKKSEEVIVDLDRDLMDYKGLDNIMGAYPEEYTEEQRKRFKELCNICPDMKVYNVLGYLYDSKTAEYLEAEEWIDTVIGKLKPEYSDAQKLTVIDNEIGKKISYSPDFDTEVSKVSDARALWRIITSGYGICNGIATVEKYILSRARN